MSNLKRSNSSSNIPLLKNRTSRPTARGSSELKGKRSNSVSSIRRTPTLVSSHGLGSSTAYARRTPTLTSGTPLLSSTSRLGVSKPSGKGLTPSSAKSPLRKLRPIDNKRWVLEQFYKIKEYLLENPKVDSNIIDNLKPLTINIFVYVCNLLFKEIDERIEIDIKNYSKTVMAHLKLLCYPGQVTNNLMKTVNTQHSWPSVISILAWLVDLVKAFKGDNYADNHYNIVIEYFAAKYKLFHTLHDESDDKEQDEIFTNKLIQAYNLDMEEYETLKNEINDKTELIHKQKYEVEQIKYKNDHLRREIAKKKTAIEEYNTKKEKEEQVRKVKKEELLRIEKELLNKIDQEEQIAKNLKETLSNQKCSYQEKNEIVRNIDSLKHTIKLKREKIQKWNKIKDDFDFKLIEGKKKLETEVYNWNAIIMKLSSMRSNLKELQLKEEGFLNEDYINEIDRVTNEIIKKNDDILGDIKKLEEKMIQYDKTYKNTELNCESLTQENNELKNEEEKLKSKLTAYNKSIENAKEKAKEEQLEYEKEMENLMKTCPDIETERKKNEELKLELENMKEKFRSMQSQLMEYMLKLRDVMFESLSNYDNIRIEFLNIRAEMVENLKRMQEDSLNFFDDLCK